MTEKRIRVLLTDRNLLSRLEALHSEPEFRHVEPGALSGSAAGADILLLDDAGARRFLESCPEGGRPTVVVLAPEGGQQPSTYSEGLADDLLILPACSLDLERMLRTHELMRALRELEHSSRSIPKLLARLQEDLQLAEKIQRRLIRDKFPALGPLSVKSKYWCGLKSGGDYFDVFELPGASHAGVILSDSSSYGLSTSLIGSLVQFSVHVSHEDLDNPAAVLRALFGKVRDGMKEKDRLSILFGIIDRKTFRFRFASCGELFVAKRDKGGKVTWAGKGDTPALSLSQPAVPETRELTLEPGERLLLASDGWGEALAEPAEAFLEKSLAGLGADGQDMLNQMAYQLRKKLEAESEEPVGAGEDFPMPPQDCSVLLFELAANALRLAK